MPLLLLDLDDTLIDRAAAFRRWATRFVAEHSGAATDVGWLIAADMHGMAPRDRLSVDICMRFGLDPSKQPAVLRRMQQGLVDNIELDPDVPPALARANKTGWTCIVVTNGAVKQQEHKLRHTGVANNVAGWVISESVGVRKPSPKILQLAAAQGMHSLDGAWMIGDAVDADIAGAHQLGLCTVWLHQDRQWPIEAFKPTHIADT